MKKPETTEDEMVNRVVTDGELDRGEHPGGQLVHISTVTHAWRGVLLGVTPSYYILDPEKPVALVDSTGAISDYLAKPEAASQGDTFKPSAKGMRPTIRIPRSAVAWMVSWGE